MPAALRPTKLYARFLRQLLPLLVLAFALAASATAWFEYRNQLSAAQHHRAQTLAAFSQALIKPLWDCDTITAQGIAQAIHQQSDVRSVEVQDLCAQTSILAGQAMVTPSPYILQQPLLHRDETGRSHPVGELRIAFTPLSVTVTAAGSVWRQLVIFAAMLIAVLASAAWVFEHTIGQPLEQLRQAMRNHREVPDIPAAWAEEISEVTQAYNLQVQALRQQALHDPLTGLGNRALLQEHLQHALHQAQRQNTQGHVLVLDLNGFKPINDRLGHAAGDTVLQTVAQRLLTCVRDSDTVARLGGDEFAIITTDSDSPQAMQALMERIRQAVAAPMDWQDGVQVQVSTSIGLAQFPRDGTNSQELLVHADKQHRQR